MEAFVSEAAVMRIGDVEVPRLAGDLEIVTATIKQKIVRLLTHRPTDSGAALY